MLFSNIFQYGPLFLALNMPCPATDTNTKDKKWPAPNANKENVQSWQECSQYCQELPACQIWTWHGPSQGQYAYKCHLMTSAGSTESKSDIVSGHKSCTGGALRIRLSYPTCHQCAFDFWSLFTAIFSENCIEVINIYCR